MAQTSISGFFPVRKRAGGDHASIKRRKLTDNARLDIPIIEECSDASSIPISKSIKVVTKSQGKAKTRAKKGSRQVSKRGAIKPKTNDIKTLFDIIGQSNKDEDPSINICVPTEPSASQLPASSLINDQPPVGVSSSCKDSPSDSPVKTKPSPSPVPPHALSRGATLVELARQKMVDKSPSKDIRQTRSRTMASRRKILSDPKPAKELSRNEVVGELYKLSAKDLALPTKYEQNTRRGNKTGNTPTLREFKSLEVKSPKKNAR